MLANAEGLKTSCSDWTSLCGDFAAARFLQRFCLLVDWKNHTAEEETNVSNMTGVQINAQVGAETLQ